MNSLLQSLTSKNWWHNLCSASCYSSVIDVQLHSFLLLRLVLLSALSVLPGLANLQCFQTAPLISQTLAAPHVTENKIPCFLGMDFHESLSSKFMFWAMFSAAVQSSNNPLECCLSWTELCLAYTHLDFCSLQFVFYDYSGGNVECKNNLIYVVS